MITLLYSIGQGASHFCRLLNPNASFFQRVLNRMEKRQPTLIFFDALF